MNQDETQDSTLYKVVVNHEEQFSIWPVDRANPLGWRDGGRTGLKAECLDFIKDVWIDMRPLSLRKQMDGQEAQDPSNRPEPERGQGRRLS